MNVMMKWLFGALALTAMTVAHAQNVNGVLRVDKGEVQIVSAKTGETIKARLGQQVYPKDVIVTGKDARAKIVMVDNNEINVSPDSRIEIQHYEFDPAAGKKDVLLNVIYGKVRAKVEQKYDGKTTKFQVKTPAAVAGVRGTDFMTSYDRGTRNSQIITFHGRVEFGLPGPGNTIRNPVFVTPGTQAMASAGGAPRPPTSVPKEQLAKMDSETKADGVSKPAGPSDRVPAADGDKDKKDDSAKKDSGTSSKDRQPANSAGPGPDGPPPPPPPSVTENCATCVAPPPPPTTQPRPPIIPVCDVCKDLIQNGNTKVNITIRK